MRKLVLAFVLAAAAVFVTPGVANAAAPLPATNVQARAGTNQATVSWAPAQDAQGRNIMYIATSSPGSRACVTYGTRCDVTGLSNGQSYTFKVTASVPFNDGNVSGTETAVSESSNAVTPRVDTAAPVLVSSTVKPGRVSSLGGQVVVELRITDDLSGVEQGAFSNGPYVTFDDAAGKSIGGLNPGSLISGDIYDGVYRYVINFPSGVAPGPARMSVFPPRDYAGNSGFFLSGPTVTVGSPEAPTNVTATATADRNALVSWGTPDDGGNVITGYTITEYPSGRTFTPAADATSYEVALNEQPADQPLTYAITAKNAGGNSPVASAAPLTIPATAPATLAKPGLTRGNTQVTAIWSPTSSPRGAAVTGYTATLSPGGKSCSTDTAGRTCDIPGLDNGTSYTVTVTATNSAGTSSPSPASDSATPAGPPSRVAGATAISGPNRATVDWSAATPNGTPITGYKVTASPGGDTCVAGATATSCAVTSLTNGTAYTFVVEALSDAGASTPSAATNAATPADAPLAPAAPSVISGNGKVTVTWPDAATNGSPITSYVATASPGGNTCETNGAGRSCDIPGLDNGTPCVVTLKATNSIGTSAASAPSALVTPAAAPDAVDKPVATAGQLSAAVTWTAPDTNGTPITGYVIAAAPGGKTVTVAANQNSATLTGLSAGTAYTFTVTATSTAGSSPASAPSSPVTPTAPPAPPAPTPTPAPAPAPPAAAPGQVSKPKAVASKKSAKVSWNAPKINGSPVTGYRITASNGKKVTVRGNLRSFKFTGLKKGKKYTFTVTALSKAGAGKASTKSKAVKVK